MGCGCGKSFSTRSVTSQSVPSSRSTIPPQIQTGTFAGKKVVSQPTPYGLGRPGTSIRRSV